MARAGRPVGQSTAAMGYLLAEMQHIARRRTPARRGDGLDRGIRCGRGDLRCPDPEVPVISIADLGILRAVEVDEQAHAVTVTITPTYSGCPAMEAIASRIAFEAVGSATPPTS